MLESYESVKEGMKTGDVIGWDGRNIIHAGIDAFTGGDIGHVSQVIRMQEYEGTERRRYHSEATGKGVLPSPLSHALIGYVGTVWWYPLNDEWDPLRNAIGEKMIALMGRGYDYSSLFKKAFFSPDCDDRSVICSEYVQFTLFGDLVGDRVLLKQEILSPPELLAMDIYKPRVKIYENLPTVDTGSVGAAL